MEFLILGGMILIMDILRNVDVFKDSLKSLEGLKIPIGIVVFLRGLSYIVHPPLFFMGLMGLIAGAILIMEIITMAIKDKETKKKVKNGMLGISVPVGFITIVAGIIGMFFR